jgi:hypothetical protein
MAPLLKSLFFPSTEACEGAEYPLKESNLHPRLVMPMSRPLDETGVTMATEEDRWERDVTKLRCPCCEGKLRIFNYHGKTNVIAECVECGAQSPINACLGPGEEAPPYPG